MSYTIIKTDGTILTTIANGTLNTTSTSVALPGRNYAGYGEYLDTNFVHIVENFADSTVPSNPLKGQLWYNTSTNTMCICPADGETTAANWYTITTTSSGGNATFGNLTITGNLLANNITATNNLDANSISCNYLTVNVNATMANANFSGTANAATFKTTAITSGSQSTNGVLTGVWTANGAGTPAGGPAGTSFYVTGGNLVISNTSSRGIVADFFYYSNGTPISFGGGGSYSNSNVAAYLPTYTGDIGNSSTTATNRLFAGTVSTGSAALAGTVTGNWALSAGSKFQATTVLDAAQPNITSVGVLSSLAVTANITAGNVNANSGTVRALYLAGDGSNITNITVGAGTAIVHGTSNVSVALNGNVTMGVSGTSSVFIANSAGVNIAGYANIGTNAFIGANANVTGNVNAGNFVGKLANGTSSVAIPAAAGNVNITVAGTSRIVATSSGANITGYANVTGSLSVGTTASIVGNITAGNFVGPLTNGGTSNVNMDLNGNVRVVAGGTTRFTVTTGGANVVGSLHTTGLANVNSLVVGTAGNVTYAAVDGSAGQVLTTYGNGVTYWGAGGGGGATSYISNGTSNLYLGVANGPIIANTGGVTRLTIANASITSAVNFVVSGTNTITGIGSGISAINASNISTGTLAQARLANSSLTINGTVISLGGSGTISSSTTAAATFNNGGAGAASGTTFDGSTARTISYNTIGAPSTTGTNATGTWGISVTGSAATVTTAAQPNITSVGNLTSLAVAGNINVNGNLFANQNVVAYSSSDSRLKENITVIENALDKIKKISGVMFDWKEGHELDRKHDTGVIAQEVEEVLPEVVITRQDGYKAVRYEKIIGLVVQAIKELSDQVDELNKKL